MLLSSYVNFARAGGLRKLGDSASQDAVEANQKPTRRDSVDELALLIGENTEATEPEITIGNNVSQLLAGMMSAAIIL